MAERLADNRIIATFSYNGRDRTRIFKDLPAFSEYLAKWRKRLGYPIKHPWMEVITDEYGRVPPAKPYLRDSNCPYTPSSTIEGEALERPRKKGHVIPDSLPDLLAIDDETLAAEVVRRKQLSPSFAAALKAVEAAAMSAAEPLEWGPYLPARAPRLWINRDKEAEIDPANFIREVYGEWLPYLSRRDLRYLDRTLYFIYAQSLAATDKASPPVEFGGNPRGRMDDAAYGANARERDRQSAAKFRDTKQGRDKSNGLSFRVR